MFEYPVESARWLQIERQKSLKSTIFKKGFIGARNYIHFDAPVGLLDGQAISKLAFKLSRPDIINRWPFMPFILRVDRMRKYRHKTSAIVHRDQKQLTHIKSRPIMIASHQDACLFSFYNHLISPHYEVALKSFKLQDCVVAYRAVEGKNNIDFAKRAFKYMEAQEEIACLLIDIKGFFENINHERLRNALCMVLNVDVLPDEIEYILKNLTKYRYVDEDEAIKELKRHRRKYHVRIPNTEYAKRFCKIEDYNLYLDNGKFVHPNISGKGIPQGSPVSGLLANIALLDFDRWLSKRLAQFNLQFYQRYSDDIIVVCPVSEANALYTEITAELQNRGVSASTKKTEAFAKYGEKLVNIVNQMEPNASTERQNLQYLGLEWNGHQITLRPSTVTKRFRPSMANRMKPKFWRYHQSSFAKLENPKPVKRQFNRMRKSIKQGTVGRVVKNKTAKRNI